MRLVWFDKAWDDYLYWQKQDKKTLKKINELIRDIERGGKGIGKAEMLKGDLSGFFSKRPQGKICVCKKLYGFGFGTVWKEGFYFCFNCSFF